MDTARLAAFIREHVAPFEGGVIGAVNGEVNGEVNGAVISAVSGALSATADVAGRWRSA